MSRALPTAINELVPLADRLRYLQLIRLLLAGVVAAYLAVVPEAGVVPFAQVAGVLVAYVGMVAGSQAVWATTRARNITLFGVLLIGDGVFLAWASWATGGPTSALRHLVLLHLVTVALLASYRTALKIAMWHSLLAVCMLHATRVGYFLPNRDIALPGTDFEQLAAFLGLAWAAVLTTAGFAAVNERELRRRKVDLEDLARLAGALEKAATPAEVAEQLRAALVDAYGFPRVVVLTVAGPDLVASAGKPGGVSWTMATSRPDAVVASAFAAHGARLVPGLDARRDPRLTALLGATRNLVVVPLFAEGHAIGVVVAEHGMRRGSRIERRVVTIVERFCAHAALALRNATLLGELRAMATTDGLTGVANRRTFEDALAREVARSGRSGEPTTLVMVDIDHFKSLNDRFGHQAGDEVLKSVARTLVETSRASDLVARYGGEEFAVILPTCSTDAALETAERLRRAVAELDVGLDTRLTASFGVATVPFDAGDGESLVRAADGALYQAKHGGRNRVVAASEGVHPSPSP